MSENRQKREQFAVAIRREQREEIFKGYRNKIKTQFIEEEQQKMVRFLDTPEKREQWIERKARDLTGQPEQNWRYIMNELLWSLGCFKQPGAFKIWIQAGIIKNICLCFAQQYQYLGLAPQAAKLLGSVLFVEDSNEEEGAQRTSEVAYQILNQEILRDLAILSNDKNIPHNETSHYFTLLGNLSLYECGQVIKSGGLRSCIEWSLRMLHEKKINRTYLEQIYSFFEVIASKSKQWTTNYNFANQVFSVLNQYIQIEQSANLIERILIILHKIIKCQKSGIIVGFLTFNYLKKKVREFALHQQENIRAESWTILAYLSVYYEKAQDLFQPKSFFEHVVRAYAIEPIDHERYDKITDNILICVSNLADEGDHMREYIINSDAIKIVIDSTHPQRSTKLRKSAYYCLCTTIFTKNYNLLNKIIYDLPIIEKIVLGIEEMLLIDKLTLLDLLKITLHLIMTSRNVYREQNMEVLQIFESTFCLSRVLQQVQKKIGQDSNISSCLDSLINLYSY